MPKLTMHVYVPESMTTLDRKRLMNHLEREALRAHTTFRNGAAVSHVETENIRSVPRPKFPR